MQKVKNFLKGFLKFALAVAIVVLFIYLMKHLSFKGKMITIFVAIFIYGYATA